MTDQNQKIALVTGASRGIGEEIAKHLAEDGFYVFVNYRSSDDKAKETVSAIENAGGNAETLQGDVTKTEDRKRMVDTVKQKTGKIDVLVNNAGAATLGPISDVTEEEWDKIYNVNTKGSFFMTKEA